MITKQKAIEVLVNEPCPMTPREAADALDLAGAFSDKVTLAEIASVAEDISRAELGDAPSGLYDWRDYARRLATACRKLGLVKP